MAVAADGVPKQAGANSRTPEHMFCSSTVNRRPGTLSIFLIVGRTLGEWAAGMGSGPSRALGVRPNACSLYRQNWRQQRQGYGWYTYMYIELHTSRLDEGTAMGAGGTRSIGADGRNVACDGQA